jgi:hypothetical protein
VPWPLSLLVVGYPDAVPRAQTLSRVAVSFLRWHGSKSDFSEQPPLMREGRHVRCVGRCVVRRVGRRTSGKMDDDFLPPWGAAAGAAFRNPLRLPSMSFPRARRATKSSCGVGADVDGGLAWLVGSAWEDSKGKSSRRSCV